MTYIESKWKNYLPIGAVELFVRCDCLQKLLLQTTMVSYVCFLSSTEYPKNSIQVLEYVREQRNRVVDTIQRATTSLPMC